MPLQILFSEMESGLQFTAELTLLDYWLTDPAHAFILFSSILLGIALGITGIMRERFENLLYDLARHFEQIASWSFDRDLIEQAYVDDVALELQRVERAVLFMDIHGFTPWSEAHTADEVVNMVNKFYRAAEPIIKANKGKADKMHVDVILPS